MHIVLVSYCLGLRFHQSVNNFVGLNYNFLVIKNSPYFQLCLHYYKLKLIQITPWQTESDF